MLIYKESYSCAVRVKNRLRDLYTNQTFYSEAIKLRKVYWKALSHTKQPSASSFDFSHRKLFGAKELLSWQRINAKDYMRCSQKINFLFPKYAKKLSIQNFSYFIISLHKSWIGNKKNYDMSKERFIIPRFGGRATTSGNPYNSRESPYWRKRFFTCPFILPKDSEKSTIENFSPPLQDALKIFRPPFAGRWKIFAPPLT